MEKLIEWSVNLIGPPWNYLLVVLVLLVLITPRVLALRGEWIDVRLGRRRFQLERERLELLKLQHELKQLGIQYQPLEVPISAEEVVRTKAPASTETRPPRWITRYPRFGKVVIILLEVILWYFTISFAAMIVLMPILGEFRDDIIGLIGLVVTYAVLAWLSVFGVRKVRNVRKRLKASLTT